MQIYWLNFVHHSYTQQADINWIQYSILQTFYFIFYVKTATFHPLKKVTLLFPSNFPLKIEILSSHTFLKIW